MEPFYDETGVGILHSVMSAERFKELREHALSLPKFGTDTADDEVWLEAGLMHINWRLVSDQ